MTYIVLGIALMLSLKQVISAVDKFERQAEMADSKA